MLNLTTASRDDLQREVVRLEAELVIARVERDDHARWLARTAAENTGLAASLARARADNAALRDALRTVVGRVRLVTMGMEHFTPGVCVNLRREEWDRVVAAMQGAPGGTGEGGT